MNGLIYGGQLAHTGTIRADLDAMTALVGSEALDDRPFSFTKKPGAIVNVAVWPFPVSTPVPSGLVIPAMYDWEQVNVTRNPSSGV